jgi:hypothetical protein
MPTKLLKLSAVVIAVFLGSFFLTQAATCTGTYFGGTGVCYPNIFTQGALLVGGGGANPIATTSVASNGQVLQFNGTTWTPVATSSLGIVSGGPSYLTNSSSNTFLNTGTYLQAPALNATSSAATSSIANLDGTLAASAQSGSDVGAQTNAAYGNLLTTGGAVTERNGVQSQPTQIAFGTNNKLALLVCGSGGGASNNSNGGSTLLYTGTTGTSTSFNTNNYIQGGATGIVNCDLQGTNGTTARITDGVYFGGGNGAFGGFLQNSNVSGFGTGVALRPSTSFNSIINSAIHFNGRNVSEPDTSGANCENMRILNSVIADSNNAAGGVSDLKGLYVQESGNCQWNTALTSFDDNQVFLDQFGGTSNQFNEIGNHSENPNGHVYPMIVTNSGASALTTSIVASDFMNDTVAGQQDVIEAAGTVNLIAATFDANNNVTGRVNYLVNALASSTQITAVGLQCRGANKSSWLYKDVPCGPLVIGSDYGEPSLFVASTTSATPGFVGIATGTPSTALSVAGTIYSGSGGFKFPDGTVQTTAASAAINYLTNSGTNIYLNTGTTLSAPLLIATSTATSTLANQDGVLTVTAFPGADLGLKESAAYTALPAQGGTLKIPAGYFTMSTQFNASTSAKTVSILCDPGGGTFITWTGSATSTIINTGQGTGSDGQSISNCKFTGTATSTGQVAIQLGGSNGNKNFSLIGDEITNFQLAIGTEANTYLETFQNDFVHGNGKAFSYQSSSNAGENIRFLGGTWADCTLAVGNAASNCIDFSTFGAADVYFSGVSFDDAQVHIGAGTRNVTFSGGHFENPWADTEPAYTPLVIDTSAVTNVTIDSVNFTNGANTQRPAQDISNGGQLTVVAATTEDYGSGSKGVADFVTNTGNGWTKIYSITKQDSAYATLYNSTGGTGTLQYASDDSGNVGIGGTPSFLFHLMQNTGNGGTTTEEIQNTTGNPSVGDNSAARLVFGLSGTPGNTSVGAIIAGIRTNLNASGDSDLTFSTSASTAMTERIRIKANGNVGIATTTPSQKLDVNGSVNIEGAANGIILHDTATASCYLVQVTNGVLTPTSHACQ